MDRRLPARPLSLRDVQQLRIQVPEPVRRAWSRVPRLRCKGLCHDACKVWQATPPEVTLLRGVVSMDPEGKTCPLLSSDGRCSVYALRPLICRAWGTVPELACPHGCEPERWMSATELESLADSIADGQRASPWASGACVTCGGSLGEFERKEGYLSCAGCLQKEVERLYPGLLAFVTEEVPKRVASPLASDTKGEEGRA